MKLLLVFILGFSQFVFSQNAFKHPRVTEMENYLTNEATNYLRARFPYRPFLVNVSVLPLRRSIKMENSSDYETAKLPYFEVESEEVVDEWDNPEVSLSMLANRIAKISITLSLPQDVSDDDVAELKQALEKKLHLIPARDEIQVQRRNWKNPAQDSNQIFVFLAGLLIITFIALIVGYFVLRKLSEKVAKSIQNNEGQKSAGTVSPIASSNKKTENNSNKGNLNLSDPIRIRELIRQYATEISKQETFPNLEQMILLEELGKESPQMISAFISEIPIEQRKKIFAYSHSQQMWWFEVFVSSGSFDVSILTLCEGLLSLNSSSKSLEVEESLLSVLRLNEVDLKILFKDLGQDLGIRVLKYLPQSISILTAKSVFPGAWAGLIDTDQKLPEIKAGEWKTVVNRAIEICPLRKWDSIEVYKREKDLLKFLSRARFQDEREVYSSLSQESTIFQIRPPFYLVFDYDGNDSKQFIQSVSLQLWATALMNLPHDIQKKILNQFNEKQLLMAKDLMRRIDIQGFNPTETFDAREQVGQMFYDWKQTKLLNSKEQSQSNAESVDESTTDESGENSSAA